MQRMRYIEVYIGPRLNNRHYYESTSYTTRVWVLFRVLATAYTTAAEENSVVYVFGRLLLVKIVVVVYMVRLVHRSDSYIVSKLIPYTTRPLWQEYISGTSKEITYAIDHSLN